MHELNVNNIIVWWTRNKKLLYDIRKINKYYIAGIVWLIIILFDRYFLHHFYACFQKNSKKLKLSSINFNDF